MNKAILFLTVLFWSVINAQVKKEITFKETPAVLKINTNQVFGTLTTPDLTKKYPVALIISGSGPTDRDGNNPMMKNNSLKMLAEALAKNGIASLRYDKRGVGESKNAAGAENTLVFENYIEDAKSWINFLKQDKRFSKIIVIGHSEGSLIGMIAAAKADKFISLAGAGDTADKILKTQIADRGMKQLDDMTFPILDSLKSGFTVNKVDPMLNSLFRPSVQPYLISWFKYNPQIEIKKLTIPILIAQGNNDFQVAVSNAENLKKANPNAEMVIIDKVNHILKIFEGSDISASLATYNDPTIPLSEVLVEKIVSFIEK